MDASKTADGRGEGARASLVALALTMSLRQADAVLLPAVYLEVQERFGVSATQLGLASVQLDRLVRASHAAVAGAELELDPLSSSDR